MRTTHDWKHVIGIGYVPPVDYNLLDPNSIFSIRTLLQTN
jgi:hypothetical protein